MKKQLQKKELKMNESILDEAKRIVHGERGENYGHPFEDFSRTAKIWSAILGIKITPEQVALCMVGLKISREINRPKRDNIVDGVGYFETLEMVKKERDRRERSMNNHPSNQRFIDWHNANKDIYGVNNPRDWGYID
jgi:Domain of unknown function (DUF6378)